MSQEGDDQAKLNHSEGKENLMALTLPDDFQLRGGQWISKCSGSTVALPTHVCVDLIGCGNEEYRLSKRAINIVQASVQNGCIEKRLVAAMSFSSLIYTGDNEALRITQADAETLIALLNVGNGLGSTTYFTVTGGEIGPTHAANITALCQAEETP